jgi:hypothetical protein
MSWSIGLIGTPEKIVAALQDQSTKLSGNSKSEFDGVLPHISELLKFNYNNSQTPVVKITASGHAGDGYGSVTVHIENLGMQLA